jgi:hypothetical protein
MKSLRFLICATIVYGSLTLFAGCRNKSNQSNPGGAPSSSDTTKVRSSSDTSKVKPVSLVNDELIQSGFYLLSKAGKDC